MGLAAQCANAHLLATLLGTLTGTMHADTASVKVHIIPQKCDLIDFDHGMVVVDRGSCFENVLKLLLP